MREHLNGVTSVSGMVGSLGVNDLSVRLSQAEPPRELVPLLRDLRETLSTTFLRMNGSSESS